MYVSDKDWALAASRTLRKNMDLRIGESVIYIEGIDEIDASELDTEELLAHGYFAGTKTVLDDIFMIITHGHDASQRNLVRKQFENGKPYWAFL